MIFNEKKHRVSFKLNYPTCVPHCKPQYQYGPEKAHKAARAYGISRIAISGGVSANSECADPVQAMGDREGWDVFIPPFAYCTDNAAMIAITVISFTKARFRNVGHSAHGAFGDNFCNVARDPQGSVPLHLHRYMPSSIYLFFHSGVRAFARCAMRGWACHGNAQNAHQLIAKGDSLLALDKPQRALEVYEQAVQKESTADTHVARARAYYELDRMDLFLKDVDKALRLDTGHVEAHYNRALYAYRADDLAMADYHATKALNHATDITLRTKTLILRGKPGELKRIVLRSRTRVCTAWTTAIWSLRTLARLYDAVGKHEEALRVLTTLCAKDSTDVGHWSNRSFELIALERYPEALVMVEKALSIDKDEPVALSNRGYIYYIMDRIKEATHDIDRSLRFYPANPYALRTRALLRIRKGDREKACEDLTLAKALGEIAEVDRLVKEHCTSETAPR